MKTYFIDTNLFIRYLTDDDSEKASRVDRLLSKAEKGEVKLITAEMVLAEIVWVLESYYKLGKSRISEMLKAILSTPGLEVQNGKVIESALPYYSQKNIDFIDAYIVSLTQQLKIEGIYSFDKKHLDRITQISRFEP